MDAATVTMATADVLAPPCPLDDRDDSIPSRKTMAGTRAAGAAATKSTLNPPAARHEESDDAATAHSSWIEDDSSRLTSPRLSFRSSHDEADVADDDDDDDDDDGHQSRLPSSCYSLLCYSRTFSEGDDDAEDGSASLRRRMSFCSSYHSAVTTEDDDFDGRIDVVAGTDYQFEVSRSDRRPHSDASETTATAASLLAGDDAFLELAERARRMLQKESEYEIDDYFHQGVSSSPSPTGVLEVLAYSPIDAGCRSKMVEWSFRVLEYSFPRPQSQSPRKHSVEAIQIVSQVFNLVDRLSTLHFRRDKGRTMDRSEYKLICMVCLHLVAKTCGMFRLHDSERETEDEHPSFCCEVEDRRSVTREEENDDAPSSTPADDVDPADRTRPFGAPPQNIVIDATGPSRMLCKRPPLNLLSMSGLFALCQDEFSSEQLIRAELNALRGLDWKITGATAVDWHRLLMDLLLLVRDRVELEVDSAGNGAGGLIAEIGERSLADLEAAMEANRMSAPSAAARTAVERILDEWHVPARDERRVISIYKEMVGKILYRPRS